MMMKGIAELKARGTKVHLSYGGDGLNPRGGGGLDEAPLEESQAENLAQRIVQNVLDWDFDGIDIMALMSEPVYGNRHQSVAFHYAVIKKLRKYLPAGKTISYTSLAAPVGKFAGDVNVWHPMEEIIAATHRYLDYVNVQVFDWNIEFAFDYLTVELGVPAEKIGWLMQDQHFGNGLEEIMVPLVDSIRQRGLRGLSFYNANQEHNHFRGEFLREIARYMYEQ